MNWYIKVLKNFATFSGRARRKELWIFTLINTIIWVLFIGADGVLASFYPFNALIELGILGGIYLIITIIPITALYIRRLHDTDRSGWWILISVVPIIGSIVLLIFFIQNGTAGENRFGPDPKETQTASN